MAQLPALSSSRVWLTSEAFTVGQSADLQPRRSPAIGEHTLIPPSVAVPATFPPSPPAPDTPALPVGIHQRQPPPQSDRHGTQCAECSPAASGSVSFALRHHFAP